MGEGGKQIPQSSHDLSAGAPGEKEDRCSLETAGCDCGADQAGAASRVQTT